MWVCLGLSWPLFGFSGPSQPLSGPLWASWASLASLSLLGLGRQESDDRALWPQIVPYRFLESLHPASLLGHFWIRFKAFLADSFKTPGTVRKPLQPRSSPAALLNCCIPEFLLITPPSLESSRDPLLFRKRFKACQL